MVDILPFGKVAQIVPFPVKSKKGDPFYKPFYIITILFLLTSNHTLALQVDNIQWPFGYCAPFIAHNISKNSTYAGLRHGWISGTQAGMIPIMPNLASFF